MKYVVLVMCGALWAGCAVDAIGSHGAQACASDGACAAGQSCYRGFCIPSASEGDDGTAGDGSATTGEGSTNDREPDGTTPGESDASDPANEPEGTGAPDRGGSTMSPVDLCDEGQARCGHDCVDLGSDPDHCGECDNGCDDSAVCEGGSCLSECTAKHTDCSGSCVDTGNSADPCGACGRACDAGQLCCDGACVPHDASNCATCGVACEGDTCCDWGCADTTTDEANCGGCGIACAGGETCVDGICCAMGMTSCDGRCVNLDTNRSHCGACEHTCGTGATCRIGRCCTGPRCQ